MHTSSGMPLEVFFLGKGVIVMRQRRRMREYVELIALDPVVLRLERNRKPKAERKPKGK